MLESVIEQVELRPEFPFGQDARLIAFFSDDYRDRQPAREEQGFISKIAR